MKIYSMTATFGKLEHETLTLKPGLNVIHAPNEWGKSTWCAFLVAMLYGMDTRARSTQTALSDKEHYAPWSGAPMSGSMELCWNGRDITIQRKTKGRAIFGDFQAFETHTGLPVPELTAANCGQTLLGVEKSVFTRSAFLRLTDLPVTQDDALRHRLNALVTTGDDSGTAERLEQKLKDLKNRCRYNRTGLLPQAEAEAAGLERKLDELDELHSQSQALRRRQTELEHQAAALENHRQALEHAKAQQDAARVVQARQAMERADDALTSLDHACAAAISRQEAQDALQALDALQGDMDAAREAVRQLQAPLPPEAPESFIGMDPAEAPEAVRQDIAQYRRLCRPVFLFLLIPGILALSAAAALFFMPQYRIGAWAALAVGLVLTAVGISLHIYRKNQARHFVRKYRTADTRQWQAEADTYAAQYAAYARSLQSYEQQSAELAARDSELRAALDKLCGGFAPQTCRENWQNIIKLWNDRDVAAAECRRASELFNTLREMAREVPAPDAPDPLTYSERETAYLIADTATQLQQLHNRLGQYQGQMESIGHRADLKAKLQALRRRTRQLEDTYAALSLALTTLESARAALQRRFAPKINQRAQALMDQLTGGRYDRLLLTQDLSIHAAARNEDTLRATLWRSDGTMDQLYLALRLAVAAELTPDAPLILDDALVRFDDERLRAAMEVLKDEAETRQVILFTCHSRETKYL